MFKTKMDAWNNEFFSELDKSQGAARSTQALLEDQDSTDDEHEAPPFQRCHCLKLYIHLNR